LVAAAQSGVLSRRRTRLGSVGRQAVNRAEYERRRWKHLDRSAREAVGHDRPEVRAGRAISVLLDRPEPFVVLEGVTRREASRIGKYESLTGLLREGQISPRRFRNQVSSWRPIRGERFLSDPDRVLAVMEARRAGEEELFVYRSGRAN
jgi:hypothetical protein